jgi:hypothetical protein
VTIGKKNQDDSVWRASYAAAEKAKIFMALKIAEGSESLAKLKRRNLACYPKPAFALPLFFSRLK